MVAQRSAFMDGRCLDKFQEKPKLLIAGKRHVRVSVVSSSHKPDHSIKVGILGASGLTGGQVHHLWEGSNTKQS
ncbi:hypothetical protein HanPI659440_Chr10g0399181 [Helianthus annuus]|nr:hypothetical protein HanPI659440_Chr10g0399181 [Helianthus annuus]